MTWIKKEKIIDKDKLRLSHSMACEELDKFGNWFVYFENWMYYLSIDNYVLSFISLKLDFNNIVDWMRCGVLIYKRNNRWALVE